MAASLLFGFAALFLKRAAGSKVRPLTTVLVANWICSIAYSTFWLLGGEMPPFDKLWQPALLASFFFFGQCLIFLSISYGDVSVATPVAGAKVIFVTLLMAVFASVQPTTQTWVAAILATLGVILINLITPKGGHRKVLFTAAMSAAGALGFASHDVALQEFSEYWQTGRLVPMTYWFVGVYSLALLPFVDRPKELFQKDWISVLVACLLIATQSACLIYSMAQFHDAARINVVYSLRGLWGVVLAWLLAGWFRGAEASHSRATMAGRLAGATLLVIAVVIAAAEKLAG